jgi:pilus assembly protein CpaE
VTILLILEDESSRRSTRNALNGLAGVEIVGERFELRSGFLLARQRHPRIVLLDLTDNYEEALNAAGQFTADMPDTALFLLTNNHDPQLLLRAIRAGAKDVWKKPLDRALLQEAVERVSRSGAARSGTGARARSITTLFSTKGRDRDDHGGGEPGGLDESPPERGLGGPGRLRRQSSGAAHVLGLKAERSISDLIRSPRLDTAALQMNMLRHSSGLAVLAQPEDLSSFEAMTPAQAGGVLDALSSTHDAVVVDAPHSFDEVSLEVLDRSSTIILLAELSIPSIRRRGARSRSSTGSISPTFPTA